MPVKLFCGKDEYNISIELEKLRKEEVQINKDLSKANEEELLINEKLISFDKDIIS